MPICAFCDRFCLTGQVCGLCARRVPYEKLKSLLSPKLPSAKAVTLETTYQPAKVVSKKSESVLASNIPGWVPKMITYLNGIAYWNTDADALRVCRDIARAIEQELDYPGEIKVTVIRETRLVEMAK